MLQLMANTLHSIYTEQLLPIPQKAGGSTMKDSMGGCHRMVQASERGVADGHDKDTKIAIVYPSNPKIPATADGQWY